MKGPYRQDPPFAVQIELTEGCNLFCNFCGLQGIREKPGNFKFMKFEWAAQIARNLQVLHRKGWNPRIEFAMHGEPTMNPDAAAIIKRFRRKLPDTQLMMTSNGGGLLRPPGVLANLTELFDAGLNVFAFDAYEYVKIKNKIDPILEEGAMDNGLPMGLDFDYHRYPDEPEWSPHNRYGPHARVFIRVQDISVAEKGTHSNLNNHCGAGSAPLRKPLKARCAKPFRELSIRWNGDVAICCNTWDGKYKCGNVLNSGISDVWHGSPMTAARRFLIRGERSELEPCNVCDAKSYRVGLLPDKKGKVKLPEPTELDYETIREATRGKAYTAMIRPWEIRKAQKK